MPDEDKTFSGSLVFGFENLMTSHAHTLYMHAFSLAWHDFTSLTNTPNLMCFLTDCLLLRFRFRYPQD